MIDRKKLLLGFLLPVSLLISNEAGLGLFRQAFVFAARLLLGLPVAVLPDHRFAVADATYEVDFFCTPALLWAGAALLLYLTKKSFGAYWRALATVLPLSAAAMVANVVLSIAMHQRGVVWTWAHYPGLFLIYAAVLFYCQRRPPASAALAAQPGV